MTFFSRLFKSNSITACSAPLPDGLAQEMVAVLDSFSGMSCYDIDMALKGHALKTNTPVHQQTWAGYVHLFACWLQTQPNHKRAGTWIRTSLLSTLEDRIVAQALASNSPYKTYINKGRLSVDMHHMAAVMLLLKSFKTQPV